MFKLLQILGTFTVSVSSAERSFSTLRRVKSWLRTRMGEDRLIGLTLLNIHWNIELDYTEVIKKLAKDGKRKLDLIL